MNYVLQGGFIMYLLLIGSIVALAIIINRLRVFKKAETDENFLLESLKQYIEHRDINSAIKFCDEMNSPVSRIVSAGLKEYLNGGRKMEDVFKTQELFEIPYLEKYIPLLGTIASVSTLIGFTGTVTGMIKAFNSIAQAGASSPQIVASGIAQALITTAAGLLIAIPTLIFYQYFEHRISKFELEIERATRKILLELEGK